MKTIAYHASSSGLAFLTAVVAAWVAVAAARVPTTGTVSTLGRGYAAVVLSVLAVTMVTAGVQLARRTRT